MYKRCGCLMLYAMSLFAQTLNIGFHMSFALYCRTLRIFCKREEIPLRDTPGVHGRTFEKVETFFNFTRNYADLYFSQYIIMFVTHH